jgi:hypothetical protein
VKARDSNTGWLLAVMLACGCEAEPAPDRADLARPVHTPLELDPLEEYEISRWWTNGRELLRLDEVGSYALYPALSRYDEPVERGRWSKTSYAALRLEPYDVLRADPIRVGVSKVRGRLTLSVPGHAPMTSIEAAPAVPEDELIGAWESQDAVLVIAPEGYRFTPRSVGLAGHAGAWRLAEGRLRLVPDAPNMRSSELIVEASDEADGKHVVLRADGESFTRQVE